MGNIILEPYHLPTEVYALQIVELIDVKYSSTPWYHNTALE